MKQDLWLTATLLFRNVASFKASIYRLLVQLLFMKLTGKKKKRDIMSKQLYRLKKEISSLMSGDLKKRIFSETKNKSMMRCFFAVALLLISSSCFAQSKSSSRPVIKKVSAEDVRAIIDTTPGPIIVNFWATWCG